MRMNNDQIIPEDYDNVDEFKVDSFNYLPSVLPSPPQITRHASTIASNTESPNPQFDQQINKIISHLSVFQEPFSIDPIQFAEFKKKADVFCACPATHVCYTLPYRKFCFSGSKTISPHGSMFSSCFIKFFLNPKIQKDGEDKYPITAEDIASWLQSQFHQMKKYFLPIIYDQNHCDASQDGFDEDYIKENINDILKYQKVNLQSNETYSQSSMRIPDFSSLLIPHDCWPLYSYEVNEEEYKNIKIPNVLSHATSENDNKEEYGPNPFPKKIKFQNDLKIEINKKLAEKNLPSFEFPRPGKIMISPEISKVCDDIWNVESRFISRYVNSAFMLLWHSMATFLETNKQNQEQFCKYVEVFKNAISSVAKYWEGVTFGPYA